MISSNVKLSSKHKMSTTDSYCTKNTRGNRKVVTANYCLKAVFKIPDGLDLEDKNVVEEWFIDGQYFNIIYTDGRTEIINWEWDANDDRAEYYCSDEEIENAEDYNIVYSEDEGYDAK